MNTPSKHTNNIYQNMVSSPEQIQQVAIQFLHDSNIKFIAVDRASFYTKNSDGKLHPNDYWVVPYTYKVFEEENAFIYVEDATQQIWYAITKHGYIHPDDAKNIVKEEADEESWDDL